MISRLCLCLVVKCLSVSLSVGLNVCWSDYLSVVYVSVDLSACLSVYMFFCLYVSVGMPICLHLIHFPANWHLYLYYHHWAFQLAKIICFDYTIQMAFEEVIQAIKAIHSITRSEKIKKRKTSKEAETTPFEVN